MAIMLKSLRIRGYFLLIVASVILQCCNEHEGEIKIETVRNGFTGLTIWKRGYYPNSKAVLFEAEFIHDTIKHGVYREYFINGWLKFEGFYVNDQLDGLVKWYYDYDKSDYNQVKKEGLIRNGLMIGPWKYYYSNGNIEYISFKDSSAKEIHYYHFNNSGELLHNK
jgi:antitoxin component YwqK of YwqJK toxin-antitoxin module